MSYPATKTELYRERKWGRDNVGARGNNPNAIAPHKVDFFRRLVDALVRQHGSLREVAKQTGVNTGTLWKLRTDSYLSQASAQKILDGYTNMRAGQ